MRRIKRPFVLLLLACTCVNVLFIIYVVKVKGRAVEPGPSQTRPPPRAGLFRQVLIRSRNTTSGNDSSKVPFVWKKEVVLYPGFVIKPPNFASTASRDFFYKWKANGDFLSPVSGDQLKGVIYHVTSGTYSMPHDCGFSSRVDHVLKQRVVKPELWKHCLVPIFVPDAGAFQHFVDGVLPKIMQMYSFLTSNPRCQIAIRQPFHTSIYEMLNKLNLNESQVFFANRFISENIVLGADTLIYTCNAPPLHPVLWKKARRALGVSEELTVPLHEAYIIVVTRSGCHNCGRNVLNQDDMIMMLQNRYGEHLVKIFKGPYSYNETLAMFSRARVIMGPHGGGMYNFMFAPEGTIVVEFMPTRLTGQPVAPSDRIIWAQSSLLGHEYWRMPLPVHGTNDMNVDLVELERLLDIVDERDDLETTISTV